MRRFSLAFIVVTLALSGLGWSGAAAQTSSVKSADLCLRR